MQLICGVLVSSEALSPHLDTLIEVSYTSSASLTTLVASEATDELDHQLAVDAPLTLDTGFSPTKRHVLAWAIGQLDTFYSLIVLTSITRNHNGSFRI